MRTLVTGGAGFIGSHVVDAPVERGDEVTVLDDISTGRRENLAQALASGAELVDGASATPPRLGSRRLGFGRLSRAAG
jgi:nucleoside-diphosphate-sugar epimerase